MAYMSEDGYKKLMAELKHLETVERPKISAAIAEERDKGDLSENAEYDAAKDVNKRQMLASPSFMGNPMGMPNNCF